MNKKSKVNNSCGLSFDHLQEKTVVEKSPSLEIDYNFSPEAEVKNSPEVERVLPFLMPLRHR